MWRVSYFAVIVTVALIAAGVIHMEWFAHRVEAADTGIVRVKDAAKSERPEFKRTYTATLTSDDRTWRLEVEMKWFLGSRFHGYGTLTQPDGKYVFFDLDNVAEKVLDRTLAAKVQAVSSEILRMDQQFIDNEPRTYTDEAGRMWTR